jgi:hypothetical protein
MNGLIMEIKSGYAVVMTRDGGFEEWKMDTETLVIGQEVEKPKSKSPVLQLGQFMHKGRKPVLQIAASLMLALMLSGTGAWAYYTPYGYINIDINPSVELTYNRFERIIDMKSLNDDGANVLEVASRIKNKSISDAIEQVVLSSQEQGYMKEDENIVLLTVTSINNSGDDVDTELSEVESWALNESVTLENRESDIENYKAAQKEGVSPGKKLLVEEAKRLLIEKGSAESEAATSNDPALTVDEKSNLGQIMKIIRSEGAPQKTTKPDQVPAENNKDKTPAGQEKNNDKTPPGQEKKNEQDGLLEENKNDGERSSDEMENGSGKSDLAPGQNKAPNDNNGNGQSGRKDKNKDHSNDSIEKVEETESIDETEAKDQKFDETEGSQNAPGQNNKDKNNGKDNNKGKDKNMNDDTGENSTNSGNDDNNGNHDNNGNNGKNSNQDQNSNDEQSSSESDKKNKTVEDDDVQDDSQMNTQDEADSESSADTESSDEIDDGDADSSNSSKSSDKSDEKKNGNSNSKNKSNNNNSSKGGKKDK